MTMEGGLARGGACGDSTTTGRIDRTSSIENEPRTLHINQMEYARQAALYVLNHTSSVEEALRIFTEGLEPVRRLRISEEAEEARWDEIDGFDHYNNLHHMHVRHTSSGFKDIATAPF